MSSLNGANRQVALVSQNQLEQMFPGVHPNTQIRISGPLIPSRFFENEESFTIHPHEPVPGSPSLNHNRISRTEPSLSERQSEDAEPLHYSVSNPIPRYSVVNMHPVSSSSTVPEEVKKSPDKETSIKSPTRDFSEEEYVKRISNLSRLILEGEPGFWAKICGPNIDVVSGRNGAKSFSMKINFEVNGIIITRISVSHETEELKNIWSVALTYIRHSKEYFTGNRCYLQYSDQDLQVAVRKSYNGLKALRRCIFCMSIWNSEMSDVCLICLFSDYFTRENELYECPVCKENIKDWTILDCNHRLCYKCLARIAEPRKCPMCRCELNR